MPEQSLAVIIGRVEVVEQPVGIKQISISREGKWRGGNGLEEILDAPAALAKEGEQGRLDDDVVGGADAGWSPVSRAGNDRRGRGVGAGEACQEGRRQERHITGDDKKAWVSELAGVFSGGGDTTQRAAIGDGVNQSAVVETIV